MLGGLAARVCREVLARAGVPSAVETWVVHEVHPITVPGGGEVTILVPEAHVEAAVRLIKEHLEETGDTAAEMIV